MKANIDKCKVITNAKEEVSINFSAIDIHNFWNKRDLIIPKVNTTLNGLQSISVLGPKIWNIIPNGIKNQKPSNLKEIESRQNFKDCIKKWKPDNCPCHFCKKCIAGVGFL